MMWKLQTCVLSDLKDWEYSGLFSSSQFWSTVWTNWKKESVRLRLCLTGRKTLRVFKSGTWHCHPSFSLRLALIDAHVTPVNNSSWALVSVTESNASPHEHTFSNQFLLHHEEMLGKTPSLHSVIVSPLVCCLRSMSLDSLRLDKQSRCPPFSRVIHIQLSKQSQVMRSVCPSSLTDCHRTTKLACTWYHGVFEGVYLCVCICQWWQFKEMDASKIIRFCDVYMCVTSSQLCMYVCVCV